MIRYLTPALLVLTVALAAAPSGRSRHFEPQARPAAATIRAVAWLAGTWTSPPGGSAVTEERWTAPAGGALLGTSRTIARDRMVAFEFLRIVERDGTLVYVAQPGGRPPTEFVLTRAGDGEAVFENPEHDFPQVISYTRTPDGFTARISDTAGQRAQAFQFIRTNDGPGPDATRAGTAAIAPGR